MPSEQGLTLCEKGLHVWHRMSGDRCVCGRCHKEGKISEAFARRTASPNTEGE